MAGTAALDSADTLLDTVRDTLWLTRPDVRDICADDRDRFDLWLLLHGAREYSSLALPAVRRSLFARLMGPSSTSHPDMPLCMPLLLVAHWRERADLRQHFDLSGLTGQCGLITWFYASGLAEMGVTDLVDGADRAILHQDDPRTVQDASLPITRLMRLIWTGRADLQAAFDLNQATGRQGFVQWFIRHGLVESGVVALCDGTYCQRLMQPSTEDATLPALLAVIWQMDADLQRRIPHRGSAELRQWAMAEGPAHYPVLGLLASMNAAPPVAAAPWVRQPSGGAGEGINLFGYVSGRFGVAEDVRMAAAALSAVGVPWRYVDLATTDWTKAGAAGRLLPYATNLFCVTGMTNAEVLAQAGITVFTGRRNIGFWPWELPRWPLAWQHAYKVVDEVWASSRFIYNAYRRDAAIPVQHVPMAVTVDDGNGKGRSSFGIPLDRFTFLCMFDALSSIARKNPMACLEAFRQAFPLGTEPVTLVIKAMRTSENAPDWRMVRDHIRQDRRIILINDSLDRGSLLDLIRACDCFISLHRAEGFGRCIAEAMMLGRPVIVTGHSGNMDFTTQGTAALVDHTLRPVEAGDYAYGEGLYWAEPDVGHAAWWMGRLLADADWRRHLAAAGQALVTASFAPPVVGRAFLAALRPTRPLPTT